MTRARTTEAKAAGQSTPEAEPAGGFGAEFRELARQRRFVRAGEDQPAPPDWRTVAAPPAAPAPATPRPSAPAPATPEAQVPPVPASRRGASRISEDQRAMLAELAKMSDRLVESREQLALVTARAERAERDLAGANDRLMAARALVHEAQRTTRETAERCAWLEGRCEALQEALELAVHAGMFTRWRWRRQQRARAIS